MEEGSRHVSTADDSDVRKKNSIGEGKENEYMEAIKGRYYP